MSDNFAKFAKHSSGKTKSDRPNGDHHNPQEKAALKKIQTEAKAAGSELTSGGKGGLNPSLVLGRMRKDKFTCKVCGEKGTKENGGIGVHHKHFHLEDPDQKRKAALIEKAGKRNTEPQLVSICERGHNKVHEKDREENG